MLSILKNAMPPSGRPKESHLLYRVPSTFIRTMSYIIDFTILGIPRAIFGLSYSFLLDSYRVEFFEQINNPFIMEGKYFSLYNPEHLKIFFESKFGISVSIMVLVMILIGWIYQFLMLTSSWSATIGNRLLNTMVIKNSDSLGMTPIITSIRIIISYIPWAIPVAVAFLWNGNQAYSWLLLIILAFWHDLSVFFERKVAVHDVLTKTTLVNCRAKDKFSFMTRSQNISRA